MSSAGTGRAPGIVVGRTRAAIVFRVVAAIGITAGFTFMAVEEVDQIRRLLWRPEEITRMLREAGTLAADYPGRFVVLVASSVVLMLVAEFRPRALIDGATAIWLGLGCVATGAYVLGTFDLGTRWAMGLLLLLGGAITVVVLFRTLRHTDGSTESTRPPLPTLKTLLLPTAVGLVGGLLAVRASIEPVTEWDAIIYHVSFARDWIASLPGLPQAAGPSVGSELSYNYPALFPSMTVAVAAPLHIGAGTVARILSPLAALTILAVLRGSGRRSSFAAWAPAMFLLGSTFFVAYAQWPTAYMVMTLLIVLAVARLVRDWRIDAASALCLGLAAETGLIGMTFTAIILLIYGAAALWGSSLPASVRVSRPRPRDWAISGSLLVLPTAVVAVSSLQRTGGLFFPWITWPHASHLLPPAYWSAAEHEILANSYGQFGAAIGSFLSPLQGIATSGLLAPGGLLLGGLIAVTCVIAFGAANRALVAGAALTAASLALLVVGRLVWLRYFVPFSVVVAVGLGVAVAVLGGAQRGRIMMLPYGAAAVAAGASLVSGAVYAIAGPNDRSYTAVGAYRAERSSAFENAREAADTATRREVVFGDDSRAWKDIGRLRAAGLGVGTFDIRNYFAPYVPRFQLDGLAGAAITGTTPSTVARQLRRRGIDVVFVPSWFWEPGPGRNPLTDRSPVLLWVGSPQLRALRVYLPNEGATYPSVLYLVGESQAVRHRVNAVLDTPHFSVEGPLSSHIARTRDSIAISGPIGGNVHWRIAEPVTEGDGPAIRLTTKDISAAPAVDIYEPRQPTLVTPSSFVDCRRVATWARESTLDVAFPGSALGFASLDVGVTGPVTPFAVVVRNLSRTSAGLLVHACGDPTSRRGGVFPAGGVAGRIIVAPRVRRAALSFDYLDSGRGTVAFNVYDDVHDRWLYKGPRITRCGSDGWRHAQLPLEQYPGRPVPGVRLELGPFVSGEDLVVRNLRLVGAAGISVPQC